MLMPRSFKSLLMLLGVRSSRPLYMLAGFPVYFRNMFSYFRSARGQSDFRIQFRELMPNYTDRFMSAGSASGHYFHQDLWAARKIYSASPAVHVDIGSRIDGFISHLLVFRDVVVIDIREMASNVDGLEFRQGDITNLDVKDDSIASVSCLHAIEHIGLGRYGDCIDYNGWRKGLRELERVIAPGGTLYLGVPIGRQRVVFDAHRVFDVNTIISSLPCLELVSMSYVDDEGDFHEDIPDSGLVPQMEYGCGLFEFRKKMS